MLKPKTFYDEKTFPLTFENKTFFSKFANSDKMNKCKTVSLEIKNIQYSLNTDIWIGARALSPTYTILYNYPLTSSYTPMADFSAVIRCVSIVNDTPLTYSYESNIYNGGYES
jgi:hypothetical protein